MIRFVHFCKQSLRYRVTLFVLTIFPLCLSNLSAQSTAEKPPVAQREIFVPLDELHVILEAETQRVFMKRAEYEQLLLDAQLKAKVEPPLAKLLTGAITSQF